MLDEISTPIFSSHTNARAVLKHRRSLSDRHIREIARRGGVVGVNYYSPQLVERGRARIEDIVKHIEHIAAVGGIDCVALGSDFDGIGGQRELKTAADMPLLAEALRREGFTEDEVERIFWRNARDFFEHNL